MPYCSAADARQKWRSESRSSGLAAGLILRYLDGFQQCRQRSCDAFDPPSQSEASYELDVHGSYRFNDWPGRPTVVASVNNALDSEPPVPYVAGQSGVSGSTYDVVGQFFT